MKNLDNKNRRGSASKLAVIGFTTVLAFTLAGCVGAVDGEDPQDPIDNSEIIDVEETPQDGAIVLQENEEFSQNYNRAYTPLSEENRTEVKTFLQELFPLGVVEGEEEINMFLPYDTFDKPALETLIKDFTEDGWTILPTLLSGSADNETSYSVAGVKEDLRLTIFNNGEDMAVITISEMIPNG